MPMEEHARWRFLLNADGQGASWRLAKLLAIDSVVLKFQSTSIEYYYRSLVQVRQGQDKGSLGRGWLNQAAGHRQRGAQVPEHHDRVLLQVAGAGEAGSRQGQGRTRVAESGLLSYWPSTAWR